MATGQKRRWRAKPGYRISSKDAQLIGETLEEIREAGEPVTPQGLLERATPARSPLHKLFQWDDDQAAFEFRLYQARKLIAGVQEITINERPVKGYHSIEYISKEEVGREYARHDMVLDDDNALSQVSADLYGDVLAAVQKAVDLGLHRKSRAWAAIQKAVYGNRPGL